MEDLKIELSPAIEIKKRKGTFNDRLDAVGLEKITDLIGYGFPLRAKATSKGNNGILNLIGVPEHRFQAWLLRQGFEQRDSYNAVVVQGNIKRQEDLVQECIDVIAEYNEIKDKIGRARTKESAIKLRATLNVLDLKQKAAVAILGKITDINKLEHAKSRPTPPQLPDTTKRVLIGASQSQLKALEQIDD